MGGDSVQAAPDWSANDADQSKALTSWSLEVTVRVRHIKLPDETGFNDLPALAKAKEAIKKEATRK